MLVVFIDITGSLFHPFRIFCVMPAYAPVSNFVQCLWKHILSVNTLTTVVGGGYRGGSSNRGQSQRGRGRGTFSNSSTNRRPSFLPWFRWIRLCSYSVINIEQMMVFPWPRTISQSSVALLRLQKLKSPRRLQRRWQKRSMPDWCSPSLPMKRLHSQCKTRPLAPLRRRQVCGLPHRSTPL
jgi:hypothetical protein